MNREDQSTTYPIDLANGVLGIVLVREMHVSGTANDGALLAQYTL